jgi:hypothetical protein
MFTLSYVNTSASLGEFEMCSPNPKCRSARVTFSSYTLNSTKDQTKCLSIIPQPPNVHKGVNREV